MTTRDMVLAAITALQEIEKTHPHKSSTWKAAEAALGPLFAEMARIDGAEHPRSLEEVLIAQLSEVRRSDGSLSTV